ncbi:MAG: phage baseplate assembly protein V [Deltaproteobacteria bacterium]|nr:phage baseplate assembly protein V [Deltaproteobacteria bacterium]
MADSGKPFYRTEHHLRRLGGDDTEFLVQGFDLSDVLNEGYRLVVRCKIAAARQQSLFEACAARRLADVEFFLRRRFPDGYLLETRIVGLVHSIQRSLSGEPGMGPSTDTFRVEIVPALELMKADQQGGTWHDRSTADVLCEVLDEGLAVHGRGIQRKLTGTYPAVDLIVRRPNESRYDFAQKLMRRTGISFHFDHRSGVETLVLTDDNDALPQGTQRHPEVPLRSQWLDLATNQEERISGVCRAVGMAPSSVEYIGFDVGTPQVPVQGLAELDSVLGMLEGLIGGGSGSPTPKGGQVIQTEAFRVNEREDPELQFSRRAQLHAEVESNRAGLMDLQTTLTGALAGRQYRIEVTPGDERPMLVTRVQASGDNFGETPTDYSNAMTVMPIVSDTGQAVPLRPMAQPDEGTLFGVFRAKVIAVDNDPLDVDGYLRCRLEFPWDQQGGEVKTTYVSVLQPMAGAHGGTQWFPRAGDRCLVTFVGGNCEQPVILGCLYDNEFQPPMMGPPDEAQRLPAAASWLGFSHASVGDKARQSMMNVRVDAGQEQMFFNAPHDWRTDVGHDSRVSIGNDRTQTVGRNVEETVDGKVRYHVQGNREETVGGNYSVLVEGNAVVDAKGGSTSTIAGSVHSTCKAGVTHNIDGGHRENVYSGDRVIKVTQGSCLLSAGSSIVARAPSVSFSSGSGPGSGAMGAATSSKLELARSATLSGPSRCTLESGPSKVQADTAGVTITGKTTALHDELGGKATLSQGAMVVDAPRGIELRCGANSLRLAPDGLFLNGVQLRIETPRTEVRTASFDIIGPHPGSDER